MTEPAPLTITVTDITPATIRPSQAGAVDAVLTVTIDGAAHEGCRVTLIPRQIDGALATWGSSPDMWASDSTVRCIRAWSASALDADGCEIRDQLMVIHEIVCAVREAAAAMPTALDLVEAGWGWCAWCKDRERATCTTASHRAGWDLADSMRRSGRFAPTVYDATLIVLTDGGRNVRLP